MDHTDGLRFPSIDGLRAFEAAARLGTFERAADELAITASAVSKRVATVEELIGSQLFSRSGKALALTAAGREYLAQVRQALGLLAAMPQHRRSVQRVQRLRVVAPPTFARQILVPELEAFTGTHPAIELEVVLSMPFLEAPVPEADIEVRHGDPATVGGQLLMRDVVVPMASPALLQRQPGLRAPGGLAGATLLRTPIEPWTPWLRAAGLDLPEPTAGPRLVDLGLTLEAAVAGQGVALGRPTLARPWLRSGSLVALSEVRVAPQAHYQVLMHSRTEAALAFADWLGATCARIEAEALALVSGEA